LQDIFSYLQHFLHEESGSYGVDGKHWGKSQDVLASMQGFANYVHMVNPEKGAELQARVRALVARHGLQVRPTPYRKPAKSSANQTEVPATNAEQAAESSVVAFQEKKPKNWWKMW
jgi:RNA-directed DNA polymerase